MEEGEAIMICIDTSKWMAGDNSHMFKEQADAIELYCTHKFKSHPETVIGICGMSTIAHFIEPCRDICQILGVFNEASFGGYLMLVQAVVSAQYVWFGCSDKELGEHLPKRIVVFAGGPLYDEMDRVQLLGKWMKINNVACDAISFGDPAENKHKLFETLIALADNNGNCNHLHVPPNSSVRDALSSSQIIGSESAPLASLPVQQESSKQNINGVPSSQIIGSGSAPLASLPVQPESSKHNVMAAAFYSVAVNTDAPSSPLASSVQLESSKLDKKAAANYPENVDPYDYPAKINALSQSFVDLKLVNVKPNSQPETLGERIERPKQELESSLLKKKKQGRNEQKNKQVAC